jgi:hypothetical protein
VVPLSTPNTSAELKPFNIIDKAPQTVPHSRVSHFSSNYGNPTKQNINSVCAEKQNIKSVFPAAVNKSHFDLPQILNKSQSPEVAVTTLLNP